MGNVTDKKTREEAKMHEYIKQAFSDVRLWWWQLQNKLLNKNQIVSRSLSHLQKPQALLTFHSFCACPSVIASSYASGMKAIETISVINRAAISGGAPFCGVQL